MSGQETKPSNKYAGLIIVGGLGLACLVAAYCCLMLPAIHGGPASPRAKCLNHLRQIGLALQSYHDEYGSFPPAYIADENGRPMHSWRVLIWPQLEEQYLFDQYDFDEPWDGPNNSKLGDWAPDLLCCPKNKRSEDVFTTNYLAVIGPRTAWPGAKARSIDEITDGVNNTIIVVEVAHSDVHWMEPRDLKLPRMNMQINAETGQAISSPHEGGANVVFVDASTHFLDADLIDAATVRALLTVDGGETLSLP